MRLKTYGGWGGYTTRDLKSSRFMSRMSALVYNWWTLFARLLYPHKHAEAIATRPLLLSSVGRVTRSGRQTTLTMTSQHCQAKPLQPLYRRVALFFRQLTQDAPQLSVQQVWKRILHKALQAFSLSTEPIATQRLPNSA